MREEILNTSPFPTDQTSWQPGSAFTMGLPLSGHRSSCSARPSFRCVGIYVSMCMDSALRMDTVFVDVFADNLIHATSMSSTIRSPRA